MFAEGHAGALHSGSRLDLLMAYAKDADRFAASMVLSVLLMRPFRYGLRLLAFPVMSAALTAILAAAIAGSMPAQAQVPPRLAALPKDVPAPADNPSTPERVTLGRLLFWDPILSGAKDVACATCHHPDFGYSDGLDLSIGANGTGVGPARAFLPNHVPRLVKRNSQTVLNVAFNGLTSTGGAVPAVAPMFWDVRVQSLETQALEPLKAQEEMRGDGFPAHLAVHDVVVRLNAIPEYRRLFARAFGGTSAVTDQNLGRALAAFQRTLVTTNTPFDRYMGGDTSAMTPAQVSGMEAFQAVGCINCHSGPMFSDFKTHVLAVPDNPKLSDPDSGVEHTYAFRTPSLRNLGATAPYMHNGLFPRLDDVLGFYRRISAGGGRRGGGGARGFNPAVSRDQIDPLARQLNMRRGSGDIIAFLRALDDPDFDRTIPQRVPSGLPVGGRIK